MKKEIPKAVYLKDYEQPGFWAKTVHLTFDIHTDRTLVISRVTYEHNKNGTPKPAALKLMGHELQLKGVRLNQNPLPPTEFTATPDELTIFHVPDIFELELVTELKPHENKALEGLYQSDNMLCTQCEAEGFRRITYFLDRPDVMATYTTRIIASKKDYPVLLSNGNPMEAGDLPAGRHFAVWHDPFPKPSYLFALVAGNLIFQEGNFRTKSGREVTIRIYVEAENRDKCDYAMQSVKWAMKWDEDTYGLEYDLDIFMIVAVSSFNAGAMENKGLNIFNSKFVLADPQTATDNDFLGILRVIGHEYFHNWSGNRVTCRDWFQLSLKEGLTVFRDQTFAEDMGHAAVSRIRQVISLKSGQFEQDRGPMAHPVRPESYVEINNFYTSTVYSKGAEVIRMIQTQLGHEQFIKGAQLYFQRHDGQAATIEDFVKAMADSSQKDFSQFMLWYSQAGTPTLKCTSNYDQEAKTFAITFKQTIPATPGQPHKNPHVIPVRMGLLSRDGKPLPLKLHGQKTPAGSELVLSVSEAEQTFVFEGIPMSPIMSVLRRFSAPVYLETPLKREDRTILLSHDPDEYNRFEAGQELAMEEILNLGSAAVKNQKLQVDSAYLQAYGKQLSDHAQDPMFQAEALGLPDIDYLANLSETIEVEKLYFGIQSLSRILGEHHWDLFLDLYQRHHHPSAPAGAPDTIGPRKLKNVCLQFLTATNRQEAWALCRKQFDTAHNMTDFIGALSCLTHSTSPMRDEVFEIFYRKWHHEKLVLDKWFGMQSWTHRDDAIEIVQSLLKHKDYDRYYPNRIYATLGPFTGLTPVGMHHPSGRGYQLLAHEVMSIDSYNPMVAARMVHRLINYKRFDLKRQKLMKDQLQTIATKPGLSPDVYEIVSKSLDDTN